MSKLLTILMRRVPYDIKQKVIRRSESLLSQLQYLHEHKREKFCIGSREAFPFDVSAMEILCDLNAFYQQILAPLFGPKKARLGGEIPIDYGGISFDRDRIFKFKEVEQAFLGLIRDSGIPKAILQANRAEDLVFILRGAYGCADDGEL